MHLAEADAAEAGAAALAERADQAVAAGVEGGSEAAEEAGGEAGEEREGEQAKAEGGAQGVGGEIVRQERDERADRERSHGRAKDTACHRKEQAIGEELAADAAAGSAESEAGADLAAPCRAAGEKEAGDVQAGEAEQNAGGGEQEPERLGEAAAQRRMALGRGGEFESGCQVVAAVVGRNDSGSRGGGCCPRATP